MLDWPRQPLSDLVEPDSPITYGVVKPGDDPEDGVLFVRGGDISGGQIDLSALRRINVAVSEQYRRTLLRGGELVVSLVGNPGQVAVVPDDLIGANIARQVGLVRLASNVDTHFVKYFLLSPAGQGALGAHSIGSVQQVINLRDLKTVEVPLPPLDDQRAIAAVLGSLDDKIEQNRRTARALERLARAIFRAWFVDFEPVKAKAAGAAAFPSMPQAVFDALPTTFTDSEIGPVPEGWEVGLMGDIGVPRREQVTPSEVDGSTPYFGLEHMPRRNIALAEWGHAGDVTSSKFRFKEADILFGKLRPYFHKVGPAPVDGVCSTDVVVLHPREPGWVAWLLMLVSSDEFVRHTDQTSAGTKMPRTNWKDMAAYRIAIPPAQVAAEYEQVAQPMVAMIQQSIHESRNLAALRDYLLPHLLSGEVPVEVA